MLQSAISILPDGTPETVDVSLLEGIPPCELTRFHVGGPTGGEPIHPDKVLEALNTGRVITLSRPTEQKPGWYSFTYPTISADIAIQSRYELMRTSGESHGMAEVLAFRKFPSFKTDSTFNAGRENGKQFEDCPLRGDWLKARAEEAGVSTTGKYYSSGLARFPGDPKAWISDRHDALRVAMENGMSVSGDVNYTAPAVDPGEDIAIAQDILDREVDAYLEVNPDVRRGDAEEAVREVITGQVDKHDPLVQE